MSKIKNFLVCGGGMMGSAIAQILAGLDLSLIHIYIGEKDRFCMQKKW